MTAVYLGEVVCSKRAPLFDDYCRRGRASGSRRRQDRGALDARRGDVEARAATGRATSAPRTDDLVEANDGSALLRLRGRPHHVGPFINVYNERTLAVLAGNGARNVCLPPEMPAAPSARWRAEAAKLDVMTEVQVFGRSRPGALGALLSRARAWPHQGQLPVRLRRGSRRHDVAHAGGQAVPDRQRHPDPVARLSQSAPASLANCKAWASRASACRRKAATWWRWRRSSATRSMARSTPPKRARSSTPCKLGAPFSNGFYRGARGHGWQAARAN